MFLHGYFESGGPSDAAALAPLSLIAVLKIYLTDFLKYTFRGENAKNRALFGGEKMKAAAVYQAGVNHGRGHSLNRFILLKINYSLRRPRPAIWPPALRRAVRSPAPRIMIE